MRRRLQVGVWVGVGEGRPQSLTHRDEESRMPQVLDGGPVRALVVQLLYFIIALGAH